MPALAHRAGFDWQRARWPRSPAVARCANRELIGCNGSASPDGLCVSCLLTRTRPADADVAGLEQFAMAEAAKRRLLFELLEIGLAGRRLPTTGPADSPSTCSRARRAGHHRPRRRRHHARPRRGRPRPTASACARSSTSPTARCSATSATRSATTTSRSLAPEGSAALERVPRAVRRRAGRLRGGDGPPLREGPAGGLARQLRVSAYATMHPWEDWAETFAHYLHIRDRLQTAVGLRRQRRGPAGPDCRRGAAVLLPGGSAGRLRGDARRLAAADLRTQRDQPQHRATGDLYPFVLAPPVVEKLRFIDGLVREAHDRKLIVDKFVSYA